MFVAHLLLTSKRVGWEVKDIYIHTDLWQSLHENRYCRFPQGASISLSQAGGRGTGHGTRESFPPAVRTGLQIFCINDLAQSRRLLLRYLKICLSPVAKYFHCKYTPILFYTAFEGEKHTGLERKGVLLGKNWVMKKWRWTACNS